MLSVIICGASGRMGKELIEICLDASDIKLLGACTRGTSSSIGKDVGSFVGREPVGILFTNSIHEIAKSHPGESPVIIDFSAPDALFAHLESAQSCGLPILVGTSGIHGEHQSILNKVAGSVPVLVAPSTSIVANLVAMLSGIAAQVLKNADIEICETHHRHKKDSPSGTAYFMADYIANARGKTLSEVGCFNRHEAGPRKPKEIGVFGLRGGSVAGTHTVNFFDEDETLEITHRTHNRRVFAVGAIIAARFLAQQPAGLYNMLDVFKMNTPNEERSRK